MLGAFAVPAAYGEQTADPGAPETGATGTTGPTAPTGEDDAEVRTTSKRTAPPARGCRNAGAEVTSVEAPDVRLALLCLVNGDRRSQGLPALRAAPLLIRSAQAHSVDMVRKGYFAHASPAGSTLSTRVKRAGYLRGMRRWRLGETLAYGSQSTTVVELFASLLASPPHRAIIRTQGFRELGVGAVPGMPYGGRPGLTVTMNFGMATGRQ